MTRAPLTDGLTSRDFLGAMLDAVPEMSAPVTRRIRSAIALDHDPADVAFARTDVYPLLWDLFNEVLLPLLNTRAGPARDRELRRVLGFLERVAGSPEPVVLDFLGGLVGDYLLDREGAAAYACAGPALRAVMVRACADWGMRVPPEWTGETAE
ncbi:hypothetical protein ACWC10_21170 [Streptomyces sp. NPDC001595]|uniref:hypothetical protein n=1 Tax=Streptomyces sp. NPDC001532 TaxID=3154520 RepID=UPI00331D1BCC